jgi:manganese efflux pump family protein
LTADTLKLIALVLPMGLDTLRRRAGLDELAIGFSAGLLRLPLVPLVVAIALQAFAVTLLGVHLGGQVGERWRESAERVAGAALIALGSTLLVLRVT